MSMESLGATWTFPSSIEVMSFFVTAIVGTTTFILAINMLSQNGPISAKEMIYWLIVFGSFFIGKYDMGWMFHVQAILSCVFLFLFIYNKKVK